MDQQSVQLASPLAAALEPERDVVGQNALYGAPAESGQDGWTEADPLQLLQEVQTLVCGSRTGHQLHEPLSFM